MRAANEEGKMSNPYAAVSALIFAIVSVMHVVRLINRWPIVIGPYNISMNASWVAFVVAGLIAIWGFTQLRQGRAAPSE
jgi:hypothetical protein